MDLRHTPDKDGVEAFIWQWVKISQHPDKHSIDDLYSPSMTMIATGRNEYSLAWDESQDMYAKDHKEREDRNLSIRKEDVSIMKIDMFNQLAWVFLKYDVKTYEDSVERYSLHVRNTMVLEYLEGRWYIRNRHLSVPFIGQKKGQSWPKLESIQTTLDTWIFDFSSNESIKESSNKEKLLYYLKEAKKYVDSELKV